MGLSASATIVTAMLVKRYIDSTLKVSQNLYTLILMGPKLPNIHSFIHSCSHWNIHSFKLSEYGTTINLTRFIHFTFYIYFTASTQHTKNSTNHVQWASYIYKSVPTLLCFSPCTSHRRIAVSVAKTPKPSQQPREITLRPMKAVGGNAEKQKQLQPIS